MIKRFYPVKNVAAVWVLSAACLAAVAQPVKVVYHMNEGIPQASRAMANIRNHLVAEPNVQIVVVAHGLGIDFLLDGAVNQMDQPFAGAVSELTAKGVEFRVCQNTLNNRKIPESIPCPRRRRGVRGETRGVFALKSERQRRDDRNSIGASSAAVTAAVERTRLRAWSGDRRRQW